MKTKKLLLAALTLLVFLGSITCINSRKELAQILHGESEQKHEDPTEFRGPRELHIHFQPK